MDNMTNQNLIHLLNQQTRFLAKGINNRLNDHGLYTSQWSIIFCIDRFGPMTQTAIWKYLNVEAPTITRTLSRMEKSGWIVREHGLDKRERVIKLTEDAMRKLPTIRHTMDQFEQSMLADLSLAEKEQLQYLLSKIGTTGENAQ
jgi:DNA-binding MarR family transcriptional regulator